MKKPENPLPKLLVTTAQVQESLSCSRGRVERLIKDGILDTVKIGPKNVRITIASVLRYVDGLNSRKGDDTQQR